MRHKPRASTLSVRVLIFESRMLWMMLADIACTNHVHLLLQRIGALCSDSDDRG